MQTCIVMTITDFDRIKSHVDRAINIIEQERMTKKDKLELLNSMYTVRSNLREDLPGVTVEYV